MSKTPRKTAARAASRPASPKTAESRDKTPIAAARGKTPAERIARALEAIATQLAIAAPPPAAADAFSRRRRLRLASRRSPCTGAACQPCRSRPAQGHRTDARHPDREYRAFCQRPARQQRAAVGRARHGKIVAGEGRACQHQCRPQAGRPAEADRDSPRGHREPAGADGPAARVPISASSCSATTCRSTATTPPTSR